MEKKTIVQKVVLAAAIIKADKILILQRNKDEDVFPNMWELPSGKKELLEGTESSLLREVKEETGLSIRIIIPFSVFDYQVEKETETRDSVQINFLTEIEGESEVKISFEHQNFAWITRHEILEYGLSEKTRQTLEKAFEIADKLK